MLLLVVDPNNRCVIYKFALHKLSFEFSGWHLEALVFDQLFDSISDVEIMLFVLKADVTRFEESIRCDSLFGRRLVLPISFEDVGAAEPEFACFAGTEFFAVG